MKMQTELIGYQYCNRQVSLCIVTESDLVRTSINTISIVRIHHENKALRVLIVMSP